MPTLAEIFISGAMEGLVDEAVVKRLIVHIGATAAPVYGKCGKQALLQRLGALPWQSFQA
jgi:hypothetical protein